MLAVGGSTSMPQQLELVHGSSWLYPKVAGAVPDFMRAGSAVSSGSYFNANPDDAQHDEKEDALVRAICNVFDSESESEDSVDTPGQQQPTKKRRNLQGSSIAVEEVSESSDQSEGSVARGISGRPSAGSTCLSQDLSSQRGASCTSGCETGDEQRSRKQKVEWTAELHDRFVCAVETLGADKAVPSKILDHMGPIAACLTRQNVASHLQKYRTRKRSSDFCRAAAYCPPAPYPCWSPFANPYMGMVGVNQFCTPAVASPWVGAASMIPTPLPQPQPAESVKSAIASLLREPKGAKLPFGLKLDCSKVMEAVNKGQHLRK